MSIQREITYSIGETEKLPGASQKQIRYWENKGDIPEAARNECGDIGTAERIICGERTYRHFAKEQVDQIKTIKSFLDKGYKLSHASPRWFC